MPHGRTICLLAGVMMLCAAATADTIHLKNGVKFDGVVRERPDGNYLVEAGGRKVVYRSSEVERVEENERTGVLDKETIRRRWEKRNAEMTALTGLTSDQRNRVEALMYELRTPHAGDRHRIRDKMAGLHAEVDIIPYLAYLFPELSHRFSPWVLETMVTLDPRRGLGFARENVFHEYAGTRAMSIELLGRLRDKESVALAARGLVDHDYEVRIAAAYTLAALEARNASAALIELLSDPNLKVVNAARSALKTLWREETEGRSLLTVEEWRNFYDSLDGEPEGTFALSELEVLIPEEFEFQDE